MASDDDFVLDDSLTGGSGGSTLVADTGKGDSSSIWGTIAGLGGAGIGGLFGAQNAANANKANLTAAQIKAKANVQIALYVVGALVLLGIVGFFLKRR